MHADQAKGSKVAAGQAKWEGPLRAQVPGRGQLDIRPRRFGAGSYSDINWNRNMISCQLSGWTFQLIAWQCRKHVLDIMKIEVFLNSIEIENIDWNITWLYTLKIERCGNGKNNDETSFCPIPLAYGGRKSGTYLSCFGACLFDSRDMSVLQKNRDKTKMVML